MGNAYGGQENYPVIRLAQYLGGLTTQQDVWTEAGKALRSFFGAHLVAFWARRSDGIISVRHWDVSRQGVGKDLPSLVNVLGFSESDRKKSESEIVEAAVETMDSGFLTTRTISAADPLAGAFLPVLRENQVTEVMLVGQKTTKPFSKDLLDVYLAVAGLVGTTASRLASERELTQHRRHLEALVEERTAELRKTNEHLRREIIQRRQAEEKVAHLNRVLRAVSRVDKLIVRENHRDRLLQGACDLLVESRGYFNTWIALKDEAGGLKATAEAGLGDAFLPLIERMEQGEFPDCTRRVLREVDPIVTQYPTSTCTDCSLASEYDGRAGMTLRLQYEDQLYGWLCASIPSHLAEDEEEQALIREVVDDIAFALHNIEIEEDRRRAEEQRDEFLSQLQATLEATADGILVVDRNGEIRLFNQRFLEMWKIPDAGLRSGDDDRALAYVLDELRAPELSFGTIGELHGHPEAKSFDTIEFRDGRIFERYSRPQILGNETIGRVWSFRDITERKRAEAEKEELEAQLRQAHKMEAIGTLVGGIAHEINNIVGIILGNAELSMLDVPKSDPAGECLQEILTASFRAKEVVRQIMTFARKTPDTRKPIDICETVKESMKLIRSTIPSTIEIRQRISCESEIVLANPTEINQILMNLCSNSVHAMGDETGVLEVMLEPVVLDEQAASHYDRLTAGEYVRLSVKDSGSGIDPDIMDRVFDPYFTTKDVDKGLGMGLAVVFGIVEKHNGLITLTSEIGKGTTAEVWLPKTDLRADTQAVEGSDPPKGNEHILLVDDEPSLVSLLTQMLERHGYTVVGKTSSKEALNFFQAESDAFDLIITDMSMPEMPGDRLAMEAMKIRPDIPVIICSGHNDRLDADRAKRAGIKEYMMKPLDLGHFIRTIRNVLDASD